MAEPVEQTLGQGAQLELQAGNTPGSQKPPQKRGPPLHQIYSRPAPVQTFPLPAFYPSNPLSLVYLISSWVIQIIRPPAAEPSVIHHGIWSPSTFSVHIVDEKSMKALWEQGFYGKGNFSRSEPNWFKREEVRRGMREGQVSEVLTLQRREERQKAKWERARLEQEAIQQIRLAEAQSAKTLILPQSIVELAHVVRKAPVGPLELLALPNSAVELRAIFGCKQAGDGASILDSVEVTGSASSAGSLSDASDSTSSKIQKSVRFSPKVESTVFSLSDPPSPHLSSTLQPPSSEYELAQPPFQDVPGESHDELINREHLQLTPEEAFFLTFGFGVLEVTDPETQQPLTTQQLLALFRQYSHIPPRVGPEHPDLQPDDKFLIHYAVYHHFRSLGFVPRAGIKFGVDWLLYSRGPVFDHAEYGLLIIPSYKDPRWHAMGVQSPERTWQWMHSIVRVLSHVMKSLVLVYVDIPPPSLFEEKLETGFAEALKLYRIREILVKRWSSNRNR